ncbi:MAG: transcriptional regulator [Proteobacteria bacterium]|nr:transcriptional regulator [Pseudomonadota bacterium]
MSHTLTPIRTEADYRAALVLAARFTEADPDPASEDGAYFDALVTLVEAWEARHSPVLPPDPIDAIKFRMEQAGLTVKDLVPSIGQPNRVYEVLNRKRALTVAMIRRLHRNLGIPAQSLIGAAG